MADGSYRFHQPGAGQFFYPQQSHRALNRPSSPPTGRRPFNNDTPSPSRSPVSQSPAHGAFNMYGQGGHQGHNVMMNGSQHQQRFNMQIPKHHNHHAPHHYQNHHHNQQHQSAHLGHQHNYSGGGLNAQTPHFTQGHMQNGSSERPQDDSEDPMTEHWQQQLALAAESRQASSPHYYARHIARDQKGITFTANGGAEDNRVEERNRPLDHSDGKRQDWMALDFGGQGLKALSDGLFRYTFLEKLFLGHNKLEQLPLAIGSLKNLVHLDISGNEITDLPNTIGMLTNLRQLFLFDNNIMDLPYELGYLYRLETLGIHGNPLAEHLKTKLIEDGTKALIDYLREEMPPLEPPQSRDWLSLDETSGANPDKFSVLNWNILCDRAATKQQYGYASDRALNWDIRKQIILNEIRDNDCDIVCLQELDRWNYDEFFRSELSYNGYKGYYAQKSRADTMGDQAKHVDGEGIFWKEKKYICLDQAHFVFGRKAVDRPGAKASADMLNRVWARDDIAVVVLLENRMTGSRLIVANTHLFWNPVYKDVKLVQVAVLVEELSKLATKWARMPPCTNKQVFRFSNAEESDEPQPTPGPSLSYTDGSNIPMIVCGDFNSNAESPVLDLLSRGSLPSKHVDFGDHNYGSFSAEGVSHPFTLRSAYGAIGELRFTNYTSDFNDVLDYIWYSSNALRVQGLLGPLDEEYLERVPGFPNEHFPSDHLLLKAEFAVTTKKGKVVEADFGPSSSNRNRD